MTNNEIIYTYIERIIAVTLNSIYRRGQTPLCPLVLLILRGENDKVKFEIVERKEFDVK